MASQTCYNSIHATSGRLVRRVFFQSEYEQTLFGLVGESYFCSPGGSRSDTKTADREVLLGIDQWKSYTKIEESS